MGVDGYKCTVTTIIILNFRYAVKGVVQIFGSDAAPLSFREISRTKKQDIKYDSILSYILILHKTCVHFLGRLDEI